MAEREGFEPPVPLSTTVFKTVVIDHSTISPNLQHTLTNNMWWLQNSLARHCRWESTTRKSGAKVQTNIEIGKFVGSFFWYPTTFLTSFCLLYNFTYSLFPMLSQCLGQRSAVTTDSGPWFQPRHSSLHISRLTETRKKH